MPKRARGGRGGGGAPRERRPALLGAPKPRPAPRPQPLPPSSAVPEASPAPPVRKHRARPSAYDKLVADLQRSAPSDKRAAALLDGRPKKILAKSVGDDQPPRKAVAVAEKESPIEESEVENPIPENNEAVDDDAEINEQDLADAGVEPTQKGDTYMAHFEHLLSQAELQSLEGATKWQSTTNDPLGAVQVSTSLPPAPASGASLLSLGVKQRVADQWTKGPLSSEELHLFRLFSSYRDVQWTKHSAARLRALYVLHAVNHIAKARDIMLANNARLNALDAKAERPELRDQGFSRPRVLILVPFRQSAVECVRLLLSLAPKAQKKEVAYRKRFNEEFGADAEEENEGWKEGKPADFVATFTGNTDDCFRLGVGFSRSAVRLYTEFYGSDLIIASPLGLRLLIDSPEEGKRDFDFLSSLELVIVDQADVLLMQNWEHMEIVFNHLNLTPKKARPTTDFSRVRTWELNALGRHYRQTLLFSSFVAVEINALFNRLCSNYRGKVKITGEQSGVVANVVPQVKQVFQRIDPPSLEALDDSRFQYFSEHVLPRMRASAQSHTLIFVASYFEYVRVRNLFQKFADENELTFCKLSEYTKVPDMARGRTFFADGRAQFMLYTERAHFYHRLRIRGVKSIVFYGLPHYDHFYTELVNMLTGTDISCLVLYTRFEAFELVRIVGEKRCEIMLRSPQNTHLIATT